jgi:hypothetical protein
LCEPPGRIIDETASGAAVVGGHVAHLLRPARARARVLLYSLLDTIGLLRWGSGRRAKVQFRSVTVCDLV